MSVNPIPEGYPRVSPYLCCRGAADAIEFYTDVFGATVARPVEDQFYGDRLGPFVDPWGHRWSVASHVEDVSEEEMGRRAAELDEH